jgi:hypothetical protein
VDLRAYNVSGRAETDTWDDRVPPLLRSWFERHLGDYSVASEEIWDLYVDRIVTVLAGPPSSTSPRATGTTPRLIAVDGRPSDRRLTYRGAVR